MDSPRIESRCGRDFPHLSRPALGPTQLPVQCVPVFPAGKMRPVRKADPSPSSSAVVMKEWSYTSTPPMDRTACTVQLYLYSPYWPYGLYRALSSAVNGRPLDFCSHRHPVTVNCLYHAQMVLSVSGPFAYCARNARCTVTTDLLCDIPTHKTTSPPERPFSHYNTLASPSGRNVNCGKKKLTGVKIVFEFFLLSVQVW